MSLHRLPVKERLSMRVHDGVWFGEYVSRARRMAGMQHVIAAVLALCLSQGPADAQTASASTAAPNVASSAEPAPIGPAAPRATPCQVATPSAVSVVWPDQIVISPSSAANFQRYDPAPYGTFIPITRFDGAVTPLISRTRDIDGELRGVLLKFANSVHSQPTVACGNVTGIFVVRFDVPSGRVFHVEVHPPAK